MNGMQYVAICFVLISVWLWTMVRYEPKEGKEPPYPFTWKQWSLFSSLSALVGLYIAANLFFIS